MLLISMWLRIEVNDSSRFTLTCDFNAKSMRCFNSHFTRGTSKVSLSKIIRVWLISEEKFIEERKVNLSHNSWVWSFVLRSNTRYHLSKYKILCQKTSQGISFFLVLITNQPSGFPPIFVVVKYLLMWPIACGERLSQTHWLGRELPSQGSPKGSQNSLRTWEKQGRTGIAMCSGTQQSDWINDLPPH